jgi:hypothetical protein
MCVGNGYVVEAVNDVFNVYSASTGSRCCRTTPRRTSSAASRGT